MRLTMHNSRGAKYSNRGYSVKHNDRNYDINKADNVDERRSHENKYWNCYQGFKNKNNAAVFRTFEDIESDYYNRNFKQQYDAIMNGYKRKRNHNRIVDFDTWRQEKRYCPEETVIQVGNIDDHITDRQLMEIASDYLGRMDKWAKEHNNCYQILDIAIHTDESVPHIHVRKVWQYKADDGTMKIGQNKALERTGLALPFPGREITGKNNYKVTYTREMRDMCIAVCNSHGFAIEEKPAEDVEHDRSKKKLIADKVREGTAVEIKNKQLKAEYDALQAQVAELQQQRSNIQNMSENELRNALQRIKQQDDIAVLPRKRKSGKIIHGGGMIDSKQNTDRGYECE